MIINKLVFATLIIIFSTASSIAQPSAPQYPSVFWKVTGNGIKKPSYIYGTMHVSNKLVYHLSDTFYSAIQSVDVVANEINLNTWQQDISKWDKQSANLDRFGLRSFNFENITEQSFVMADYIIDIKNGLKREPNEVNGILYKNYISTQDFEENTYLDMYIYQTARKFGKRAAGLEDYELQSKLMIEAKNASALEKEKKKLDMEGMSNYELMDKIEEAYRKGNMNELDSLEQFSMNSKAYWDIFLYERNNIHAKGIDSIIKAGSSVFAAIGAAHLAGERGVIEMMRSMGYTLQPIIMSERDATKKDSVDKLRVPVKFDWFTATDSAYKVKIPGGKFYQFNGGTNTKLLQYSDVDNGAYYLVTRVSTHASLIGHDTGRVLREVDSLLYENIPGKIISKKSIIRDGYNGFDIVNKTKSGNMQRYQIYITPFEVLIFKISGIDEYVTHGTEANEFFGSIQLRDFSSNNWQVYKYKRGGFSINMPAAVKCFYNNYTDDAYPQLELESIDPANKEVYLMMRKSYWNPMGFEDDSLHVRLVIESFKSSECAGKELFSTYHKYKGFPCMDATIQSKDSATKWHLRCLVKGASYIMLCVKGNANHDNYARFFNSIELSNYIYPPSQQRIDTIYQLQVSSPIWLDYNHGERKLREEESFIYKLDIKNDGYIYKDAPTDQTILLNDPETGEKVYIMVTNYPEYYKRRNKYGALKGYLGDSYGSYIEQSNKEENADAYKKYGIHSEKSGNKITLAFDSVGEVYTFQVDSVLLDSKDWKYHYKMTSKTYSGIFNYVYVQRGNITLEAYAHTDSSADGDGFISEVLKTLKPRPENDAPSIHAYKSDQFMKDYYSADTIASRRARSGIVVIDFKKNELPLLEKMVNEQGITDKNYFDRKRSWIFAIAHVQKDDIEDPVFEKEVADLLKRIYISVGDTVSFKNTVLRTLSYRATKPCLRLLKEFLMVDPPLSETTYSSDQFSISDITGDLRGENVAAPILFPDLLTLAVLPDYKTELYALLANYVEGKYIKPKAYADEVKRILFDARIELKRQKMKDERALEEEKKEEGQEGSSDNYYDGSNYYGGRTIVVNAFDDYMKMLYPFYDKNKDVRLFFDELQRSKDPQVSLGVTAFFITHGRAVADTVINKLASKDQYRSWIYSLLKEEGLEKKFPIENLDQTSMAKAMLLESVASKTKLPDSMEYVGKEWVNTGRRKGYIYYFKYKEDKKDDWQMALSGIQPTDGQSVSVDEGYVKKTGRKIKAGKDILEQFREQTKMMIVAKTTIGGYFYYKNKNYISDNRY
jgi:uncharacterized protein YbaP (TraB family)